MTKKDYVAISNIIAMLNMPDDETKALDSIYTASLVLELANYMTKDNPRFDRVRFFKACGLVQ